MTNPLSEIKAGDEVILRNGGYSRYETIEVVERTTKNWIILSRDRKFRKSDGYSVGGRDLSWFDLSKIKPATPELKEKIRLEEAFRRARRNVRSLADRVNTLCSQMDNSPRMDHAAAAIPHLQAALAVLEADQSNEQS